MPLLLTYALIGASFVCTPSSIVLEALDAAEDIGQVDGLGGDAARLQQFLAVADSIESGGPGADGSRRAGGAARWPRGRPPRTSRDRRGSRRNRPLRCAAWSANTGCRTGADCCRPTSCRRNCRGGADAHLAGGVRRRLHQHRHVEAGQPQRVGDRALVAEVRQGHDDAVDPVPVLLEQRGAAFGLVVGFHGAMPALLFGQHDDGRSRRGRAPRSARCARFSPDGPGRSRGCRR